MSAGPKGLKGYFALQDFYKESIVLIKYITLLNTIKFFNYNTHFKKLSYVKTYLYYTELYIKN